MQQLQYCSQIIVPESSSKSLAEIRNELTEHALKTDATHFLWLDGDEIFPQNMVQELLKHDKDIVGAWTVIRQDGKPNVYKMVGKYKHTPIMGEGLKEVDRLGFGSILIKREVFEKLKRPWFSFDKHHHTEDLYFCDKAREAGFKIYNDFNLRCLHISLAFL
jgi:GT2 family glycosyltransferase